MLRDHDARICRCAGELARARQTFRRHALSLRYMELGYDVSGTELDAAYAGFTDSDRKKRVYDQDLISLLSFKIAGAAA